MTTFEILGPAAIQKTKTRADRYGIFCSLLCLLHCSFIPLLLWGLPVLAKMRWLGQPIFHQCAALICSGIVVQSIVPGCRMSGSRTTSILAGTGLATVLIAAFILPDACRLPVEPEFAPFSIDMPEIFDQNYSNDLEYCSYYGDVADGIPRPSDPIYLISPMITVDQLKRSLGVINLRRWKVIQPWLSPSGGLLLILAYGVNSRILQHGQPRRVKKLSRGR